MNSPAGDAPPDPPPPWQTTARGVTAVLGRWLDAGVVKPCLALSERIDAAPARFAAMPAGLHPNLLRALAGRGVQQLYSHQGVAIEAALAGKHTVIATPTSSGKSLCFHLPVLTALAQDPGATALYLYPTKALSRDQEHDLKALIQSAELNGPELKLGAIVFDGDTRADARKAAREQARIVLSNPDMLHAGILPNHPKWAAFFQGLRYVVLDELHTYRGVFGSHMAHVLSRLQRLAHFHGGNPTFLCATATIGNPREHAARLLGVPEADVTLVGESGAPRSNRQVLLYNPPIVDEALQIRGSALKHAVNLATDLIEARVPTIVFAESRNSVEIILKYLRERCPVAAVAGAIMGYRGGYLPETRRSIEQGLREGNILCVVATNALELGIDIGDLDAVICVGYPGSIASLWQRFGRAGRRGADSIALMVCSSRALDQYLARRPKYVLSQSAEEARIDPDNSEILLQHLKCAAFEAPFTLNDAGSRLARPDAAEGEQYATLDAEATRQALDYLGRQGLVHAHNGRYTWTGEAYPASHVSLRSIGWDNFVIIDKATGRSLAELDWRASHTMLHEQAIYQHDAEQYQVEQLDYENHKAYVRKVEPDYFTTALTYRDVEVIEEFEQQTQAHCLHGFGEVKVLEKVTGYKKIKFNTHENAGYGDVHLPEMQMHTTAFWLTLPEATVESIQASRAHVVEALRGVGLALETVSSFALMCEPQDINRTLGNGQDAEGAFPSRSREQRGDHAPTLFLFDAQPGGVGLARRIYHRAPELLRRAAELIESCPCEEGCPGCIGPADSRGERKRLAIRVARLTCVSAS